MQCLGLSCHTFVGNLPQHIGHGHCPVLHLGLGCTADIPTQTDNLVIIRHLVLPGCIDNSLGVLDWIADNFPKKDVLVSLMSQYVPMGRAKKLPPFDRRITQEEYDAVLSYLYLLELDNGYTQDFSAASAEYIPEFDLEGL